MGRPPIGKRAMTSTERSDRRRARLYAGQPATKPAEPATKPADSAAELLAAAKARIAELERQLQTANQPTTKPATKPAAHESEEIARLKARIAELNARIADLERQDTGPFAGVFRKTKPTHVLTATEYARMLRCFHPDVVARLNDPELTERFTAAVRTLTSLKDMGYVAGTTVEQERAKRREKEEQERKQQEWSAKAWAKHRKRQAAARKGQETKARKAAERAADQ